LRPSSEKLRKLFRYDQDTGILYWRVSPRARRKAGDVAGSLDKSNRSGYIKVQISGRRFKAHQIIWAMMTGNWPDRDVDHIDRLGSNNCWKNLRLLTHRQNTHNSGARKTNQSGVKNVCRKGSRWTVYCWNGAERFYESFKSFDAAVAAAEKLPNREFMSCFTTDATDAKEV
jgi:hypothetical protein